MSRLILNDGPDCATWENVWFFDSMGDPDLIQRWSWNIGVEKFKFLDGQEKS